MGSIKTYIQQRFFAGKQELRKYCEGTELFYVLICGLVPLFICGELFVAVTHRGAGLLTMLMLFSSVLVCGYMLAERRKSGGAPWVLLLIYSVWLIGTRIVLGDTGLLDTLEHIGYIVFATVICFMIPRLMGSQRMRDRLLRTVLASLICFFMMVSILTLVVPILGIGKNTVLGEMIFINENNRLIFCHIYCTIVGLYAVLGICSAIICAVWTKNKVLRAILMLCAVFMLTMQSATDARASNILSGVCIGTTSGLLLYNYLSCKKIANSVKTDSALKWVICIAAGILLVFASIKYSSLSTDLLMKIGKIDISDRGLKLKSFLTLQHRVEVYKYAINDIRENPKILLMGKLRQEMVVLVDEAGTIRKYNHFHSSFFCTLYETGLPGVLIMTVFLILTVIRSLKVFFNIQGKYKIYERLCVLFIAVIMVLSLIEPVIFSTPVSADMYAVHLIFIFFCGYIFAVEGRTDDDIKKR